MTWKLSEVDLDGKTAETVPLAFFALLIYVYRILVVLEEFKG